MFISFQCMSNRPVCAKTGYVGPSVNMIVLSFKLVAISQTFACIFKKKEGILIFTDYAKFFQVMD